MKEWCSKHLTEKEISKTKNVFQFKNLLDPELQVDQP